MYIFRWFHNFKSYMFTEKARRGILDRMIRLIIKNPKQVRTFLKLDAMPDTIE